MIHAWKIADDDACPHLISFDGTHVVVGTDLARIAALPNEAWAAFAWKVIGEDFGLLSLDSCPWPMPSGTAAEALELWLRSEARHALNQSLAEELGGTVIQFRGEDVRLALCTPIGGHRPDWAWVASRDATGALCSQMGIFCATHTVFGGSHVGKAREHLLWDAMATPATHILFVDDDMGWDPRILMSLMAADMDFVAAVGCRKQETFSVCCNFLENPQHFDERTGFLEVRDVGFAFVLLKRAAVLRLAEAYPELEYRTTNGRREWALFLDMIDQGDRLSEDFSFCRRWRAIGGRIFIDQDAALLHAGRKEFTGRPSQLFETVTKDIAA
jgi:predicted lipid carrier protein YhbT